MRPELILLPGLLCDHRLWAPQIAALSGRALVSVADLTLDDTLAAMADRVLAAASARFALAGMSMGGYLAMEIMRRAPERVDRLALVDTTALPDTADQSQRRRDSVSLAAAGGFAKILPAMLPNLVHPDHAGLERVGGVLRDMAATIGPDAFARQQNAIMRRPDSRPGLPRIGCPTLIVVGAEDALTPPARAEEMAALIPRSVVEMIGHCGHVSPLEQPQLVVAAFKRWLAM